jgi:hypothetical protein
MKKELDMRTIERMSKQEGRVLSPLLEKFLTTRLYENGAFYREDKDIYYLKKLIEGILVEIVEIKKEINRGK